MNALLGAVLGIVMAASSPDDMHVVLSFIYPEIKFVEATNPIAAQLNPDGELIIACSRLGITTNDIAAMLRAVCEGKVRFVDKVR